MSQSYSGKKIHMVGIGGIGMSALAQLYKARGAEVSGSDRSESPTTAMLRDEKGIEKITIGHTATCVPEDVDLIVYSDAVPSTNPERVQGRELGVPELSYFEALGEAAAGKRVVAIAGTHGKTTTTAMIGKILVDAGEDPTVIVGSITSDFGSNFRAGQSDLFVVEACEYKRHLLTFKPRALIITNIELDHTDYFKDLDDIVLAFREAAEGVVVGGDIIANPHDKTVARVLEDIEPAVRDYTNEESPLLLVPGEFNEENARAAKAAVHAVAPHISDKDIDVSLGTFKGTWRRFEHKGTLPGGAELYDDYAHHPTAIARTLKAAREKFPDKKIVIAFHPHLFSRTRDLFGGFVDALSKADEVFILPVYAARETYDPAVSHEALATAINKKGGNATAVTGLEEAAERLRELGEDTVAFTMGAGDVYRAGEEALK